VSFARYGKMHFEGLKNSICTFAPSPGQETTLSLSVQGDFSVLARYAADTYFLARGPKRKVADPCSRLTTGGVSLFIQKNIPHRQIALHVHTNLQVVAAAVSCHRLITVCSI